MLLIFKLGTVKFCPSFEGTMFSGMQGVYL
jgi:hypothetical protein